MNEVISKAIGMVCAIGQAIGNILKREGSGNTTALAGNEVANANNSISNTDELTPTTIATAGSSHADYSAQILDSIINIFRSFGYIDWEQRRQALIEEYMALIQKNIEDFGYENFKNCNYQNLKTTQEELVRRRAISRELRMIDILQGENADHIITKSQMELLGRIAVPVKGCTSIIEPYTKDVSDDEKKKWLTTSANHPVLFPGWQDYDHEKMNQVLREYDITDPDSVLQFMVQCSNESNWGKDTLQPPESCNYDTNLQGAGYIQLTTEDNVKEFYKDLVERGYNPDPRILDFSNINNPDIGPALISKLYPWEASAFYWTGLPMSKPPYAGETLNQIASLHKEDRTVTDNICSKCAGQFLIKPKIDEFFEPGDSEDCYGAINVNKYAKWKNAFGSDYHHKKISYALMDGIFN